MKLRGTTIIALCAGAFALTLTACSPDNTKTASSSQNQRTEQAAQANSQQEMLRTQPVPNRPWSQIRQNLIELETAQADTTQTTTFFFNQGVSDPIQSCPSIGFPIATTSQLTNPEQVLSLRGGDQHLTVPQMDPNGIYTGNSTGTYAICLDAQGRAYANYWEGFVQTVTGPARWNAATHKVELVGPPSFNFTKGK